MLIRSGGRRFEFENMGGFSFFLKAPGVGEIFVGGRAFGQRFTWDRPSAVGALEQRGKTESQKQESATGVAAGNPRQP